MESSAPPLIEEVSYCQAGDARLAITELRRSAQPSYPSKSGGRAFLLIHGFAQNRWAFSLGPMPELLLKRGARVFLGELRGHGLSQQEGLRDWTLGTHLREDLPAMIDHVRARSEAVYLVGHSMGGMLGYALLSMNPQIRALITFGAPLCLGRGRPLVRLASVLARPLARPWIKRPVPMDRALSWLAAPLSDRQARGPKRAFQKITRLVSPAHAEPEGLARALSRADPESLPVFREFLKMSTSRRRSIAGIELLPSVRQSPLPVVAVVGRSDIFAPVVSVAPMLSPRRGPRRVIEVHGAHVDLTLGYHLPETIEKIWRFAIGT